MKFGSYVDRLWWYCLVIEQLVVDTMCLLKILKEAVLEYCRIFISGFSSLGLVITEVSAGYPCGYGVVLLLFICVGFYIFCLSINVGFVLNGMTY